MISARRAAAMLLLTGAAACGDHADEPLTAEGTVEVREVDAAPMVPARVVSVRVEEGARVAAGDTLATLTQATLPADIAARRAQLQTARAELGDLEAGPRAAEIRAARAELTSTDAEAARTARDRDRMAALQASGAVSRQDLDAAQTAATQAASRRDAAASRVRVLEEGARPQQIAAARAQVAQAEAALSGAQAAASDLVLLAPASGTVLGRHAEPGEIVAAGTPVLTIGRTDAPWVRVYVAASVLPSLATGQRASISAPGLPSPLPGTIVSINDEAEFTPRVALTTEERADQLFGVKVEVRDTTGVLKAGMPATVRFETRPAATGGAVARPAP